MPAMIHAPVKNPYERASERMYKRTHVTYVVVFSTGVHTPDKDLLLKMGCGRVLLDLKARFRKSSARLVFSRWGFSLSTRKAYHGTRTTRGDAL